MQYYNRKYHECKQNISTAKVLNCISTAYGKDIISTDTNKLYHIKIKIITNISGVIVIRIDEADRRCSNSEFYQQADTLNYSYANYGDSCIQGKYTKYGDRYSSGDIT